MDKHGIAELLRRLSEDARVQAAESMRDEPENRERRAQLEGEARAYRNAADLVESRM